MTSGKKAPHAGAVKSRQYLGQLRICIRGGGPRQRVARLSRLLSGICGTAREKTLHVAECGMGNEYYGVKERGRVGDVIALRSLFRWYGRRPNSLIQCSGFEEAFGWRMCRRYVLGGTSVTSTL